MELLLVHFYFISQSRGYGIRCLSSFHPYDSFFVFSRPTTLIPVCAGLGAVPRHPTLMERESMWGDVVILKVISAL